MKFSPNYWKLDVSLLILYGDKYKYIDVRHIINLQVYLLFLAAGVLEDKVREKELVNAYIFQQPIALCKTGRFQNNSER